MYDEHLIIVIMCIKICVPSDSNSRHHGIWLHHSAAVPPALQVVEQLAGREIMGSSRHRTHPNGQQQLAESGGPELGAEWSQCRCWYAARRQRKRPEAQGPLWRKHARPAPPRARLCLRQEAAGWLQNGTPAGCSSLSAGPVSYCACVQSVTKPAMTAKAAGHQWESETFTWTTARPAQYP